MSGPGTPAGRSPKVMSNRLMTMKFMQRAAHVKPISPVTTQPESPSEKTPSSISNKSYKRHKSNNYAPSTSNVPDYDLAIEVRRAADAEEAKRQEALARLQSGSGETRWAFAYRDEDGGRDDGQGDVDGKGAFGGIKIIEYGDRDVEAAEVGLGAETGMEPWRDGLESTGRMKFGLWKENVEPSNDSGSRSGSDSDGSSDSSEEGEYKEDGIPASISHQYSTPESEAARLVYKRRKRQAKEDAQAKAMAAKRRETHVNLNAAPQSISSGKNRNSTRSDSNWGDVKSKGAKFRSSEHRVKKR